jgi:hypothetical protein
MFAVVAVVFTILGLVGVLAASTALLWAVLFIALGVALGGWPFWGAPWRHTP